MKITKKEHKAILHGLFFETTPNGLQAKHFPLEKLAEAGTALKKLAASVDDEGKSFVDGEIEFSPSEIAILKDLFDGKKEWDVRGSEHVLEVKNIFDGK